MESASSALRISFGSFVEIETFEYQNRFFIAKIEIMGIERK